MKMADMSSQLLHWRESRPTEDDVARDGCGDYRCNPADHSLQRASFDRRTTGDWRRHRIEDQHSAHVPGR